MSDVTDKPARVCDCMDLQLGVVVHDTVGNPWVFVGYLVGPEGRRARFAQSVEAQTYGSRVWQYDVDTAPVLLAKFPDAGRLVTGKTTVPG